MSRVLDCVYNSVNTNDDDVDDNDNDDVITIIRHVFIIFMFSLHP